MSDLQCSGVGYSKGGSHLLDGVSVAFGAGKLSAIVGPNGAGKSTLMRLLAGLDAPVCGAVSLKGEPLLHISMGERARTIGYLPQAQEVHWDLSVEALVALGRLPNRSAFAGESEMDRVAIADALAATDMTALAGRAVSSLSGGERTRALLARVLAGRPQWLLADEPLTGLDLGHQGAVMRLFADAAHRTGMGVVMVLHDLSHAMNFCDRVVLLDRGKVLGEGSPQDVLTAENIRIAYGVDMTWVRAGNQWVLGLS